MAGGREPRVEAGVMSRTDAGVWISSRIEGMGGRKLRRKNREVANGQAGRRDPESLVRGGRREGVRRRERADSGQAESMTAL